ncbi:hypothetical protein Tco_1369426 [Tanacetum coccineum]
MCLHFTKDPRRKKDSNTQYPEKAMSRIQSYTPEENISRMISKGGVWVPTSRKPQYAEVVLFYNGLDVPVLFYNGLDVPTRQILDSRGAIPSKTAADVKVPTTPNIAHSKKKGKPSREVYYTQFGAPFQGGGYRATALGFYQRNNAKLVQEKKAIMRNLRKIMGESAKKTEEENSNLIRTGIRASRMGHKKTKEHQLSC